MKNGFRPNTIQRQMLVHVSHSLRAHFCNIEGRIHVASEILKKDYWSRQDIEDMRSIFKLIDRCDLDSPFERSLKAHIMPKPEKRKAKR
jgi:hypothetical protein